MPSVLKVRIVAGRDLPIMDRTTELTDAFVEIVFASFDVLRTTICKKTLDPIWNQDFRFEVSDDADLQNEPLEIRVMDYDAITANDSIGAVLIDLNPLLTWNEDEGPTEIKGWFPIYDSLRGNRGEIQLQIRLQIFEDINPFKDSSAGVQFLSISKLPNDFYLPAIQGFVEVLLHEDDPEYHWSDSFRTPRSSNDVRQKFIYKLSGRLRRQLGRKVLEMGGNAVVGFRQAFDLENEDRAITARAYGTCCTLFFGEHPIQPHPHILSTSNSSLGPVTTPAIQSPYPTDKRREQNHPEIDMFAAHYSLSAASLDHFNIRSYPSQNFMTPEPLSATSIKTPVSTYEGVLDGSLSARMPSLSSTPHSASITSMHGHRSMSLDATSFQQHPTRNNPAQFQTKGLHSTGLTYPRISNHDQHLITMTALPAGFIESIGGIVSAVSVKLMHDDETPVRDSWWSEIREEVKSHAKQIGCSDVLGYEEGVSLCDELWVAWARGTACRLVNDPHPSSEHLTKESVFDNPDSVPANDNYSRPLEKRSACSILHIPYSTTDPSFPMSFSKCAHCQKKYVPDLLLTTIEPPEEMLIMGDGVYIEAHVCRSKKNKDGESNAINVSDAIPFVEYDIHRQLIYKLRIQGLNAIFSLKFNVSVGDSLLVCVASGTAFYAEALPPPQPLKISRNLSVLDEEDKRLLALQERLMELSEENRKRVEKQRHQMRDVVKHQNSREDIHANDIADDQISLHSNFSRSNSAGLEDRNGVVLQIDDDTDEDLIAVLLDPIYPQDFSILSSEYSNYNAILKAHNLDDGLPPEADTKDKPTDEANTSPKVQLTTQTVSLIHVDTISMVSHHPNRQLSAIFRNAYDQIRFQCSHLRPCILTGCQVKINIYRDYCIELGITGTCIGKIVPALNSPDSWDNNDFKLIPRTVSLRRPNTSTSAVPVSSSRQSIGDAPLTPRQTNSIFGGKLLHKFSFSSPKDPVPSKDLRDALNILYNQNSGSDSPVTLPKTWMNYDFQDCFNHITEGDLHRALSRQKLAKKGPQDSSHSPITTEEEGVFEMEAFDHRQRNHSITSFSPIDDTLPHHPSYQSKKPTSINIETRSPPDPIFLSAAESPLPTQTPGQHTSKQDLGPDLNELSTLKSPSSVDITPLSTLFGFTIERFIGRASLYIIKESHSTSYPHLFNQSSTIAAGTGRDIVEDPWTSSLSGIGSFIHVMLLEAFTLLRAHVAALGGDALIGFRWEGGDFNENNSGGQGAYSLLMVSGDVVKKASHTKR